MINTFTLKDDILRFIYSETTPEENELIMEKMLLDDELYQFYLENSLTKDAIDDLKLQPSESTINRILQYASNVQKQAV